MPPSRLTPDEATLFDLPAAPLAAAADPATSAEAGERHRASGRLRANAGVVLELVRKYPGSTSLELFYADNRNHGLDRHEVSRRAADLKNAGLVRQGESRKCTIKKVKMVTWWPSEETA